MLPSATRGIQNTHYRGVTLFGARKDSILWGAIMTERKRARPQTARA